MNHKFKPFEPVLVRDSYSHQWKARHFSHYCESDTYAYKTTDGNGWQQCIPFEGNEHLFGIENIPVKEFDFGQKVRVWDKTTKGKVRALYIIKNDSIGYHMAITEVGEICFFKHCEPYDW